VNRFWSFILICALSYLTIRVFIPLALGAL
jgi:hypothetical protein